MKNAKENELRWMCKVFIYRLRWLEIQEKKTNAGVHIFFNTFEWIKWEIWKLRCPIHDLQQQ